MDNEIRTWLYDIFSSIEEVETYFQHENMSVKFYKKDTKTKRAVERNLEIIGEAMNRIVRKDPDFYIENAYQIIGTRNRIIHGYDVVSDEYIFEIIQEHLPALKEEVETLLKK